MKYHESCPISPSVKAAALGYTNKVKTRLQQIGSYLRVNVGWWLTENIILMAADIIDNMIYKKVRMVEVRNLFPRLFQISLITQIKIR